MAPPNQPPIMNADIKPAVCLMSLPDELLLRIYEMVILIPRAKFPGTKRRTHIARNQSLGLTAGLKDAAGLASWFSVNRRIRYMVLGIVFSSIVFKANYGLESGDAYAVFSSTSLATFIPALPGMEHEAVDVQQELINQIKFVSLQIEPLKLAGNMISENLAHLCLRGIAAELETFPPWLGKDKRQGVHCAILWRPSQKSKVLDKSRDSFLRKVIQAMRSWKAPRPTIGYFEIEPATKFVDGKALSPGQVIQRLRAEENIAVVL